MKFRALEPGDVKTIMVQEKQGHALLYLDDDYEKDLLQSAYTVVGEHDGEIMVIFGVTEMWQGRAQAWALLSRQAGKHLKAITVRARSLLDAAPFRRIEAQCDFNFPQADRWLKMLGFQFEGVAEKFNPDGSSAKLWARLK